MAAAFIDGQPASLIDAVGEAAGLLGRAQLPVIAGMGTDIAGAKAAIRLAELLRCPFDHMASEAALDGLSVMRDAGWMIVSPDEARRLADLVLVVGAMQHAAWPMVAAHLPPPQSACKVICLGGAGLGRHLASSGYAVETMQARKESLPGVLATLRAQVAGRPVAGRQPKLRKIADTLRRARFGVALWAPDHLDRMASEMLAGLVKDLNAATRFSSLPLPSPDNAMGVAQAAAWLTGYPMRTGFGRGYPEHDPWRFAATRLVERAEADAALWISAYRAASPPWRRAVPLVALSAPGARFPRPPRVLIEVGIPGVDHDAVSVTAHTAALAHHKASAPSERPQAARILDAIASEVREFAP